MNNYNDIHCDTTRNYYWNTTTTGPYWKYNQPEIIYDPPIYIPCEINPIKKERGEEDMRYLYYVILVNPKNDTFFTIKVIAKSEISALMEAYNESQFKDKIPFDDLKTNCKMLMEWEKKESLEKAIETIKKAVE